MPESQKLASMTVTELRKLAKENGISLASLTTKSAIIERIQESIIRDKEQNVMIDKENRIDMDEQIIRSRKESPRRATIITDESDESVPLTPVKRPKPMVKEESNKTSTGKIKPAFTLQGSRAWHNPRPFAQTQTPPSRYAPQSGQTISTLPKDSLVLDSSAFNPKPRTVLSRPVSRFGPDASSTQETSVEVPARSLERSVYQPSVQQHSSAFRSLLPGVDSSVLEYDEDSDLPIPEPSFLMDVPVVMSENREATFVPSLPATGDCGDGAGILEIQTDGYGFLRAGNLLPGRNDVYISGTQIRRFRLRNGDYVEGKTRPQRENDRYAAMLYITAINGEETQGAQKLSSNQSELPKRRDFDELTPIYPNRILRLSSKDDNDLVLRLIDLFIPIGFGQRAMIVAAPKAGKTTILKKIALSLKHNHPQVHSIMLLVDERPEEVTDLKESVGGDIFYSTFDEPAESHAKVSELTLERAMRLVEEGKDVVILLDSLTRLSRAYNMLMPGSARVMTGGLAAGALNKPKRFFGAARNLKEGGSLTIIATALVDTGSRMDGVIFEEFKGTGNMELTLDRQLSERRLFPAVSLIKSGTRHEELLLTEKEMEVTAKVRDRFAMTSEQEGISLLLSMLEKSRDNDEFVSRYDDWMKLLRS